MQHFKRSLALFAAISAIMNQGGVTHNDKLSQKAQLGGYYSRGKGGRNGSLS